MNNGEDYNNFPIGVMCFAHIGCLHAPDPDTLFYVFTYSTGLDNIQIALEYHGVGNVYSRGQVLGSDWSNWVRVDQGAIPSFYKDYSTLASLASALGVINLGTNSNQNFGHADADGILHELVYDNNTETYPTSHGTLFAVLHSNAQLGFAIFVSSAADIYFSRKWVDWSTWKRLATV